MDVCSWRCASRALLFFTGHSRRHSIFASSLIRSQRSTRSRNSSFEPSKATTKRTDLQTWLEDVKGVKPSPKFDTLEPNEADKTCTYLASANISEGEVILEIPGDICVTIADANEHPIVGELAQSRGELVGLTLWLMAEKSRGSLSAWAPYIKSLPEQTLSPILWTLDEIQEYLAGSPILRDVEERSQMLESEWQLLHEIFRDNPEEFSEREFNKQAFFAAFAVVLSRGVYLPAANCFALLPPISGIKRTGYEDAVAVDYDTDSGSVHLTAKKAYKNGEEILLSDGRPNRELLLSTGYVEQNNPSDCIEFEVSLVQTDRLYTAKRGILEAMGYGMKESFPAYKDRMPVQLLSYVRLARVTESAELTKVRFDEDSIISQMNEYEVLQLLLGDCRDGLGRYRTTIEEDIKDLQNPEMNEKQRIGRQLIMGEKIVLQGVMDNVRARLAPIRGIPTKNGLEAPNQELLDIFQTIEELPQKPKQILDGFMSWARGEQDPSWGKKNK